MHVGELLHPIAIRGGLAGSKPSDRSVALVLGRYLFVREMMGDDSSRKFSESRRFECFVNERILALQIDRGHPLCRTSQYFTMLLVLEDQVAESGG